MPEAVKEIMLMYFLLVSLGISVELPIIVKAYKIGVIIMVENPFTGVRRRNIDT
jgi:hypothetical protein